MEEVLPPLPPQELLVVTLVVWEQFLAQCLKLLMDPYGLNKPLPSLVPPIARLDTISPQQTLALHVPQALP